MRAVGEDPAAKPHVVRRLDLAVDGGGAIEHGAHVGGERGVGRQGAEIGERAADIAGDHGEQRFGGGGKEADLQFGIEEQGGDIGAVQHVLQIVRRGALAFQGFLQLAVQRGEFLVEGLQFLLRGHQLLVGGLELLVDRQRLLVDGFLLFVGQFEVVDRALQFGAGRVQFTLDIGDLGGAAVVFARLAAGGLILRIEEADQQQVFVGAGERLYFDVERRGRAVRHRAAAIDADGSAIDSRLLVGRPAPTRR